MCGTVSGVIGCLSSYYFDTIKVHMQVEPQHSMTRIISNIVRTEGVMRLFSGIYYPLVTAPLVSAVSFSSYELYKSIRGKTELGYLDGFENGLFAGLIISFIVSPVELVKCQMQMNPHHSYKNSRHCLQMIYKEGGIKGVFKGLFPTAVREIPSYGFQFATYECLKDLFVGKDKEHLNIMEALLVGPLAALCSELFTYPQDVIKTRIQLSPDGTYAKNRWINDEGFMNCGRKILKAEGSMGYIRGLKPCLLRAVLGDGIGIVVY